MVAEMGVEDLISLLQKQIVILKERASEHGAFDMFERAANNCRGEQSKSDLADVLASVKMARLEGNPFNEDSLIDYLNYRAIETIFIVSEMRARKVSKQEDFLEVIEKVRSVNDIFRVCES